MGDRARADVLPSWVRAIDCHGHLNFDCYDEDRDLVVARAKEAGVASIAVGINVESSARAIELSGDGRYATVGLHPLYVKGGSTEEEGEEWNADVFATLAQHPALVALGECGLDYSRLPAGDEANAKALQRAAFEGQIAIAAAAGKPLMIHCRDAYDDVLGILDEAARAGLKPNANFHFFAGSEEHLKVILDRGYTISFTGVITFADSYAPLVRYAPLDRILSETDCPYVAPVPHRGKRNEPAHVVEVIKAIARLKGVGEAEAEAQLLANAGRVFRI
jgi:TatD DNase family protein